MPMHVEKGFSKGDASLSMGGTQDEAAWEMAEQRVLLYLQALDCPPIRRLELALMALRRARGEGDRRGGEQPVAVAMNALRTILGERSSLEAVGADMCLEKGGGISEGLSSMPSLNRGHMLPEYVERDLKR